MHICSLKEMNSQNQVEQQLFLWTGSYPAWQPPSVPWFWSCYDESTSSGHSAKGYIRVEECQNVFTFYLLFSIKIVDGASIFSCSAANSIKTRNIWLISETRFRIWLSPRKRFQWWTEKVIKSLLGLLFSEQLHPEASPAPASQDAGCSSGSISSLMFYSRKKLKFPMLTFLVLQKLINYYLF